MQSMTGYGSATVQSNDRELTAEIKSVNHRFLDLNIKLPRSFLSLEDFIRKKISSVLSRGHVDVYITYQNRAQDSVQLSLDVPLLTQYVSAVKEMILHHLPEETEFPNASYYASLPGVLSEKHEDDDEQALQSLLDQALTEALGKVREMQCREGDALQKDLQTHLNILSELRDKMTVPAQQAPALYAKQLTARIQQLGVSVAEDRLAQEIAVFADRAAVDEELSRLASHIQQANQLLVHPEPVGKKFDFLLQEMNREANTIASKSPCLELTDLAVHAKNEIEKLREQIQNIQ